jgi:hypothetical protein
MFGFVALIFIFVVAAIVAGTGFWLLVRGSVGNGKIEIEGWGKVDAPMGGLIVLAVLAAIVFAFKFYAPQIQAENDSLTADKTRLETEIGGARTLHAADVTKIIAGETSLQGATEQIATAKQETAEEKEALADEMQRRSVAENGFRETLLALGRGGLSDAEIKQYDEIDAGAAAINSDLTYFEIVEVPAPKLANPKALAVYEVYRKDWRADAGRPRGAGAFDFDTEAFKLEGDRADELERLMSADYVAAICQTALAALKDHARLPPAIEELANRLRPTGFDPPPNFTQQAAELTYMFARLKLLSGRTAVWVRGFADGEQGPWREPLQPFPYAVSAHANTARDAARSETLMTFEPQPGPVPLGAMTKGQPTYGNADLPDLRANEIAGITARLIDGCPIPGEDQGRTRVSILDGVVYPQHRPVDRKVRIYVAAFPRN